MNVGTYTSYLTSSTILFNLVVISSSMRWYSWELSKWPSFVVNTPLKDPVSAMFAFMLLLFEMMLLPFLRFGVSIVFINVLDVWFTRLTLRDKSLSMETFGKINNSKIDWFSWSIVQLRVACKPSTLFMCHISSTKRRYA